MKTIQTTDLTQLAQNLRARAQSLDTISLGHPKALEILGMAKGLREAADAIDDIITRQR